MCLRGGADNAVDADLHWYPCSRPFCPGVRLFASTLQRGSDPQAPGLLARFVVACFRLIRFEFQLVGAVIYLASEASSYVTGQSITIEGGILSGADWDANQGD